MSKGSGETLAKVHKKQAPTAESRSHMASNVPVKYNHL